jgi:hypothetical protein
MVLLAMVEKNTFGMLMQPGFRGLTGMIARAGAWITVAPLRGPP